MYEYAVANMAQAQFTSPREVMFAMRGIASVAKHAPVDPKMLRESMMQALKWADGDWSGA